jgi:molybdenum cofactor guanylyltransferase
LIGSSTEPALCQSDAAGFVLAGGQSSRMGRDKALLNLAGKPLIVYALSALRGAGLPASIAGAASDLAGFVPVVPDTDPGHGPLSGICAALAATSAHYAVFLTVDTPFLPPALLGFLLHHAQVTGRVATIPSVNGFAQTFPAVIHRAALPALHGELVAGHNSCFAAFRAASASVGQPISYVAVELIAQSGHVVHPQSWPPYRWFLNLNTPGDLDHAAALAARRVA